MSTNSTLLLQRRELLLGGFPLLGHVLLRQDGPTTSVFSRALLLRHAEKAADDPQDPLLSEAGHERARSLERLLGAVRSAKLYATDYRRTRQTLAPLAERLGVEPEIYDPRDLEALAGRLGALDPSVIAVVVGHSNTTPALARSLGAELEGLDANGAFHDAQYDRLVVLSLARTGTARPCAVTALELYY